MKNKERIAYIGLTASLLLGGAACKIGNLELKRVPEPTPIASNGFTPEQLAELAKLITESKGQERIIINVPAAPVAPEQPALKQAEPAATAAPKVEPKAEPKVEPKVNPTAEAAVKNELRGDQFILSGFPERVDPANVLVAKGVDAYGTKYDNTIGKGTEMVLANPGVLKVGPEFPEDKFKALGKSVLRYNPSNQKVLTLDSESWAINEGAFTMINGNDMTFEFAGNDKTKPFKVQLGGDEISHWTVIIRGLFPDSKTPSDRNRTVKVTANPAGHTMFESYPRGSYLSEAHLKQIAVDAHTNAPNNGDAGAINFRMILIDANTGAYSIVAQKGVNGSWEALARNW